MIGSPLHELVQRLGGQVYAGGAAAVVPGPGHSRRDRSLSLRLSPDGRVVFYSHAGDDCRSVMSYLGIEGRHSESRSSCEERLRLQRHRAANERRREAEALRFCESIWTGVRPLQGSPAAAYLAARGLGLPASTDVGFHPAAPRSREGAEVHPAMVALVRSKEGAPRGLHVTFIAPDGSGKAFGHRSRLMFGPVAGGAVRLAPVGADGVLAVGEGIETTLAFGLLYGVASWAALSTSGLRNLALPFGVRLLRIGADGDEAGRAAALTLAERMQRRCEVTVEAAPDGSDWADVAEARP